MMRLWRNLFGVSRRVVEADEMLRQHEYEIGQGMQEVKSNVVYLERLVAQLKVDAAKW